MTNTCCLCGQQVTRDSSTTIPCLVCGNYDISLNEYNIINRYTEEQKLKISIFIRQLNIDKYRVAIDKPSTGFEIYIQWQKLDDTTRFDKEDINEIIKTSLPISERLNKALINLSKLSNYSGEFINILLLARDYPIFYPDNKHYDASKFILFQLIEDKFVEYRDPLHVDYNNVTIRLTPKGWNKVAELESTNKNSKKVFVAMWFSDEMLQIFDKHIKPTIDGLGREYDTFHIAQREHNNDITDEIIAGIKTSKFVIADLTGDRGGVYYEAGFAKGLGIPVILTCREDWFKKTSLIKINHSEGNNKEYPSTTIHFDVDHLNIIVWKTPEELSERLKNRILATID